jgi:hypothetical protein
MADNLSTTGADAALNAWAALALYVQLHTSDPGSAGTANVSSTATREAVTWSTASGGVLSAATFPSWTNWAGVNGEIVTDISFWTLATAGVFEGSMTLNASVTMDTTDSLTLTALSVTLPTAS